MKRNNETFRKLSILEAISRFERPTMEDIHVVTGIPKVSITRLMSQLFLDFGVEVRFVGERGKKAVGGPGYYCVVDWGVINKFKLGLFLSHRKTQE